jgi:hypothetical protein
MYINTRQFSNSADVFGDELIFQEIAKLYGIKKFLNKKDEIPNI